jgi:predicted nucleic acid-binding protein
MRIIVSDSSCLIDLRKASLLEAFLSLPYEKLIPNTLFESELLKFSDAQKQALLDGGLQVVDIPGPGVLRAQEVIGDRPRLSIHDGFAFVLAESHDGCILVTGDGELRTLASEKGIEVHGLLWIIEQIHLHTVQPAAALATALRALEQDVSVRLPRRELLAAIRRYEDQG